MTTKKTKTKAVAKVKEKKEVSWAGAQSLMGAPPGPKEQNERSIILTAAKALNISPFGVNILGNLPYINKLGLKEKQEQYGSNDKIVYDWVQVAMDDMQKAICKAKLVDSKGKDLCDWVIGECSPVTIKMGTLKGYQNHMAQTRARNRAILETYGIRIHEEMMENIQKMIKSKEVNEQEVAQIGMATNSSVEEIVVEKGNAKSAPAPTNVATAPTNFLAQLKAKLFKDGAQNEKEAVALINKKSGLTLKDLKLTEKHAQIVLFNYLNTK